MSFDTILELDRKIALLDQIAEVVQSFNAFKRDGFDALDSIVYIEYLLQQAGYETTQEEPR
jgi:hypothetical protein